MDTATLSLSLSFSLSHTIVANNEDDGDKFYYSTPFTTTISNNQQQPQKDIPTENYILYPKGSLNQKYQPQPQQPSSSPRPPASYDNQIAEIDQNQLAQLLEYYRQNDLNQQQQPITSTDIQTTTTNKPIALSQPQSSIHQFVENVVIDNNKMRNEKVNFKFSLI